MSDGAAVVEQGPGWEIRLGSCLDPTTGLASLADGSVDHFITDPPYSERVHKGQRRGRDEGTSALSFGHLTEADRVAFAAHAARLSRRWVVSFSAAEEAHALAEALEVGGMRWFRFGAWVKPNAMPQFAGNGPSMGFEAIVIAVQPGKTRWNGGGRPAVWWHPTEAKGEHETAKPLGLMETLVRDFSDRGELVCDPYAGSGTTGLACVKTGRRFLGWEASPGHFKNAVRRLKAAREQLAMFEGA